MYTPRQLDPAILVTITAMAQLMQRITSFGATLDQPAIRAGSGADGNINGIFDATDYLFWRDNGSADGSVIDTRGKVPEPATLVLFVYGAAGWPLR